MNYLPGPIVTPSTVWNPPEEGKTTIPAAPEPPTIHKDDI